MRRESRKHVWDALDAARLITEFVTGRTFDDYLSDIYFRSAVERQFTIIGEALVRLKGSEADVAEMVPNLREILAFRNVVVHGYDALDHDTVWGIARRDVPDLAKFLAGLLEGDEAT